MLHPVSTEGNSSKNDDLKCVNLWSFKMRPDELIKKWDEWIGRIYTDIQKLLIMRHIFVEVQKIIKANPRIHQESSFYSWMSDVYVAAATMGVRRQVDNDSQSISLVRLLEEIKKNPEVLTRKWFVALYTDPGIRALIADRDFDRFAGTIGTHVDPSFVEADIVALKSKAKNLERYATKLVAHLDKKGPTTIPTFHDLEECVDFMEELLKKYLLLLRADCYTQILPTWQYDWQAIFREPWIPPEPDSSP